jgi:pimeloyl-ACP methyl ester carboxylesterase
MGASLVLLHGFCETSAIWDGIVNELSKSCEVIVIDLPGFGGSQELSAPTSIRQTAIQVHNFLGSINVNNYFVAGHSLGGYISLELADLYPSCILGIGLINSSAFADDEDKIKTRLKSIKFVEKRGVELFINSFVPQLFANKEEVHISTLKHIARKTPQQTLINYTHAMMQRKDMVSILAHWSRPFFFFAGTLDILVPIDKSRNHLDFISRDNFVESELCAHMGMYEAPESLVNLLTQLVWIDLK